MQLTKKFITGIQWIKLLLIADAFYDLMLFAGELMNVFKVGFFFSLIHRVSTGLMSLLWLRTWIWKLGGSSRAISPPQERENSIHCDQQKTKINYQLLWKNESQKCAFSEEGPECCHKNSIAPRYSSPNSHGNYIEQIILCANGYQESRKGFFPASPSHGFQASQVC